MDSVGNLTLNFVLCVGYYGTSSGYCGILQLDVAFTNEIRRCGTWGGGGGGLAQGVGGWGGGERMGWLYSCVTECV